MLNFTTAHRPSHTAARRIGYCLLAWGLALPTPAYPLSLQQLLELPLETLLQLEIDMRTPAISKSRNGGHTSARAIVAAAEVSDVR